jgi:hypothetical protein
MVAAFNLAVFSVIIDEQLVAFPACVPKAVQATADLERVLTLSVTDMD